MRHLFHWRPNRVLAGLAPRHVACGVALVVAIIGWMGRDAWLAWVLRHRLQRVPGVSVTFDHVHLTAWPAGIEAAGVRVDRRAKAGEPGPGGRALPLLRVARMRVGWRYGALLRGMVSCSAELRGVEGSAWRLERRAKRSNDAKAPAGNISHAWAQIARFALPLTVDSLDVTEARFVLHDLTLPSALTFAIENIALSATDLSNRKQASCRRAHLTARAAPAGGRWQMDMDLDPAAASPDFSLRATLKGASLPQANDLLRAYAKFDVESGTLSANVALHAAGGMFDGSIEPTVRGLEIRSRAGQGEGDSWINRLYRKGAQALGTLLTDKDNQTIATRVPLSGKFGDPSVNVAEAVSELLLNAYLRALKPGVP